METQNGSREWITVIKYTSAGQFMLPPVVIYKGKAYTVVGLVLSVMLRLSLATSIHPFNPDKVFAEIEKKKCKTTSSPSTCINFSII